jgi:hypothetical protein
MEFDMTTSKQTNWHLAIAAQACSGVPYVEGIPGDTKTAWMQAFAALLRRNFFQHILATQVPEDVAGMPRIGKVVIDGVEYECVEYIQSRVMLEAVHGNSFVCLDEFPHASRAVQAANQEVWLNNPPENAIVVAVGNPPDLATDHNELAAPVVNRMCMLDWESDSETYFEGLKNGEFPEPSIPVLPDNWSEYRTKWMNMVAMFGEDADGRSHFDVHSTYPKTDAERSKPWRSKRSWYNAAVNLGAAESVGASKHTATKILAGFVGEGPAQEFMGWYDTLDFPSAAELFNDPKNLNLPRQFAPAHAIVRGVVAHARNQSEVATNPEVVFEKGMDFIDELHRCNPELANAATAPMLSLKPKEYREKVRDTERTRSRNEAASVSMN